MKTIRNISTAIALSLSFFCLTAHAQTTAASSMHYGKPTAQEVKSADMPIVITNCSPQEDMVSAWFTDGSSNTMPIYPVSNYPDNIISIGQSSPYVDIQVAALDGTIIYPEQPVYPGQNVNIGCNDTSVNGKTTVTVTSHN